MIIIEFLIEAIIYFFVEIIFGSIIIGLFRNMNRFGTKILSIIHYRMDEEDIRSKYEESSIPYFISFSILIGFIWMIVEI